MATPTVTGSPVSTGLPQPSTAATPVKNGAGISIQSILQSGQISGELKNLVSLLSSSANRLSTPSSPQTPVSTSRKRPLGPTDTPQNTKRRRGSATKTGNERQGKGLRHFSQKVCEKVRERGTTTYNEVAEELVKELTMEADLANGNLESSTIDQKNIRRRVYDALNVLMAMNIISKEKKEIRWLGLPTNSAQECKHLESELGAMEQRVAEKQTELEHLLIQILSFKNLMKRNRERVSSSGLPAHNSSIGLPFILVNTSKKTSIDCSISSDKSEYVFNFDNPFELHNDIDILKKMGLDYGIQSGSCSPEDLKAAKSLLPKSFGPCLDEIVANSKEKEITPASTPERSQTPPPQATPSIVPTLTPDHILAALGQTSHPSSPIIIPGTPTSGGVPSPQAVTALVSSVMRNSKLPPPKSPSVAAKALLNSLCPSNVPVSPLVKSTSDSSTVQSPAAKPLSNQITPQKVVTVSKLPSPENISSLLEQLQQSSALSKLISTAATGGASRQLFTETKTTGTETTSNN